MSRDVILESLLKLSDRQLDPVAKDKLRELIGLTDEEVRKPLLFILDDCVHGSLCSNFEITVMDALYRSAGGKKEDMAAWREERKPPKQAGDRPGKE
jgi:hypothetical protein